MGHTWLALHFPHALPLYIPCSLTGEVLSLFQGWIQTARCTRRRPTQNVDGASAEQKRRRPRDPFRFRLLRALKMNKAKVNVIVIIRAWSYIEWFPHSAGEPLWSYLMCYINNLNTKWRPDGFAMSTSGSCRKLTCVRMSPLLLTHVLTHVIVTQWLSPQSKVSRCKKNGCGWVAAVWPRVSACVPTSPTHLPRHSRRPTGTRISRPPQRGRLCWVLASSHRRSGNVPLSGRPDWHLVMWQSLARKEKKKKDGLQEAL